MQEEFSRTQSEAQFPLAQPTTGAGFFEIRTDAVEPVIANTAHVTKATPVLPPVLENAPATAKKPVGGTEAAILLTNADLLVRHGEPEMASHLLRKCLYINSYQPEALKRLAVCLTKETQMPLKTKVFEALVKSELCFENVAKLGHCYYQQNQDDKAKATYQEALSLMTEESKELFELFKNLGNISMREGDFDSAEEHYNRAFNLNQQSDILHVNLGTLALQQQSQEQAVIRFRTALEINPRNDKAWVGLALVHNEMGDHVLSRANLENALDVNSRNRTAVHLAASWAVRDQDYQFAIDSLESFVSDVECDEEMSLLLIHLFCMRSQFVEAQLELERLLLWDPMNEKLLQVEQEIRNARNG